MRSGNGLDLNNIALINAMLDTEGGIPSPDKAQESPQLLPIAAGYFLSLSRKMVAKSPLDAMRSHIDFKEKIELIGNTDIGIQSKKRTEAYQSKLNKERAKEIIRDSWQNMYSMFNLFRGRSRFVYMLLENILSNYSIKLIDCTTRYEECVDMVTGVVQMLVGHIAEKIEKNPTVGGVYPRSRSSCRRPLKR